MSAGYYEFEILDEDGEVLKVLEISVLFTEENSDLINVAFNNAECTSNNGFIQGELLNQDLSAAITWYGTGANGITQNPIENLGHGLISYVVDLGDGVCYSANTNVQPIENFEVEIEILNLGCPSSSLYSDALVEVITTTDAVSSYPIQWGVSSVGNEIEFPEPNIIGDNLQYQVNTGLEEMLVFESSNGCFYSKLLEHNFIEIQLNIKDECCSNPYDAIEFSDMQKLTPIFNANTASEYSINWNAMGYEFNLIDDSSIFPTYILRGPECGGTFEVTLEENGCIVTDSYTCNCEPLVESIDYEITTFCDGFCTNQIEITTDLSSFNFYWLDSETGEIIIEENDYFLGDICPYIGKVALRIESSEDCFTEFTIVLPQIESPAFLAETSEVECLESCSGLISVTLEETPEEMELFSIWSGEEEVSNGALCEGQYNVQIESETGCIFSRDIEIISETPNIIVTVQDAPICETSYDASASFSTDLDLANFTSNWYSTVGGEFVLSSSTTLGFGLNKIELVAIGDNGCVFTEEFTINEVQDPPAITFDIVTLPSCEASHNGEAEIEIVGDHLIDDEFWEHYDEGTSDWNSASSSTLGIGQNRVTLEFNTGCSFTYDLEIDQTQNSPQFLIQPSYHCEGNDILLVDLEITTADTYSFPLSGYTWELEGSSINSQNESILEGQIEGGLYTVQWTDGVGCQYSSETTILPEDLQPTQVITNLVQPWGCAPGGSITSAFTGSPIVVNNESSFTFNYENTTDPFTYTDAGNSLVDPIDGDYTITATNSELGCVFTSTQDYVAWADYTINPIVTHHPSCEDNTISILLNEAYPKDIGDIEWSYFNGMEFEPIEDIYILNNGYSLMNLPALVGSGEFYGYNIYEPCVINGLFNTPDLVSVYPAGVSESDTFILDDTSENYIGSNDLIFSSDLIVASDYVGVISEREFYFKSNTSLIIQPGANITFDNCTFTSCDTWRGIDLYRTSTEPVAGIILNHCTIEHAENGIGSAITDWTESIGGDFSDESSNTWRSANIFAHNGTTFHNCISAISLVRTSMDGDEIGGFNDCTFLIDDDYRFFEYQMEEQGVYGGDFHNHIGYKFVKGYNIINCKFYNNVSDAHYTDWSQRGEGIRLFNARTAIKGSGDIDNPDFGTPNFSGLNYGIYMTSTHTPWNASKIRNNVFDKNRVGIYMTNTMFQDVRENVIRTGEGPTTELQLSAADYEGIALLGGTGWAITDNYIEGTSTFNSESRTFGIRVRDTRTADDRVYKNTLDGLDYAILANGTNVQIAEEGADLTNGLRLTCNTNTGNLHDFTVADFADATANYFGTGFSSSSSTELLAISPFQNGNPVNIENDQDIPSAGNTFTQSPLLPDGHFLNEGEPFYYLPLSDALHIPSQSAIIGPVDFSIQSISFQCLPQETPEGMGLVNISGDIINLQFEQIQADIATVQSELGNVEYLRYILLDEGDTETLKGEVMAAWSDDTWVMRDKLLGVSPHVSKKVLYEVADKTTVLPHPIALEVFLANPDVLKDNSFLKYLESKSDPMPAYMVDLLYDARNLKTVRTELNKQSAYLKSVKLQNEYLLLRALYNSSSSHTAAASLRELNLYPAAYPLLMSNTSGAMTLSEIPDFYGFNPAKSLDYTAFESLYTIKQELEAIGKSWNDCSTEQFNQLTQLAEQYQTYAGRYAMEVLNQYFDGSYYIPPATGGDWSSRAKSDIPAELSFQNHVQVYPNPASNLINVVLALQSQNELNGTLKITDSAGRIVYSTSLIEKETMLSINTTEWASGFYYCIIQTNTHSWQEKIEIIH